MRRAKDGRHRMGDPVTLQERKSYLVLRGTGMSPEMAARTINRSKSWAYNFEREQREANTEEPRGPVPSDDLSEAVDLIIAERTGDEARALEIVDRFSAGIVPFLTQVSWFLAVERTGNLNSDLKVLLEDTPMGAELRGDPITAEEILAIIPVSLRKHRAGANAGIEWKPPRAEAWMRRLVKMYPELQEIDTEAREALAAEDPDAAMLALRKGIYQRQESA